MRFISSSVLLMNKDVYKSEITQALHVEL